MPYTQNELVSLIQQAEQQLQYAIKIGDEEYQTWLIHCLEVHKKSLQAIMINNIHTPQQETLVLPPRGH